MEHSMKPDHDRGGREPLANAVCCACPGHEIGPNPASMRQALSASGFEIVAIRGVQVCPRTVSGFIQKWTWRIFAVIAGFLRHVRHGRGVERNGETFSANLDLFAIASKTAGKSY